MSLSLRTYWRSSCSWRVRIALHYKGCAFESIPVHLIRDGGEQHGAAHRALNPMGQVPVLLVGDDAIGQSMAILEYLEETVPTPSLLPTTPIARAHARQVAEVINSGIQPLQNLKVMQTLTRQHDFEAPMAHAWSRAWIQQGFEALETLLVRCGARYGGDYCVGESITFADLCLVPQIYNARRFQVDLEPFPRILAVEAALTGHAAFVAAHPDNQPDAA